MLRQDLIFGLAPTQHSTLARNNTSLLPPSVLPPPHTHTFQHIIFCKIIGPRLCVRFFVKGARSVGPPTPTRLGKVYKRALVVPPSFPHQRAFVCGACIGTAQVGVSLVSLFDPLFKRSRLHYFDICLRWYLWHTKIWWQYLVPTCRVCTVPRYATIPKLTYWHVVSVLLNIWWSAPKYATIPILICQHVVSVLLNKILKWRFGHSKPRFEIRSKRTIRDFKHNLYSNPTFDWFLIFLAEYNLVYHWMFSFGLYNC